MVVCGTRLPARGAGYEQYSLRRSPGQDNGRLRDRGHAAPGRRRFSRRTICPSSARRTTMRVPTAARRTRIRGFPRGRRRRPQTTARVGAGRDRAAAELVGGAVDQGVADLHPAAADLVGQAAAQAALLGEDLVAVALLARQRARLERRPRQRGEPLASRLVPGRTARTATKGSIPQQSPLRAPRCPPVPRRAGLPASSAPLPACGTGRR